MASIQQVNTERIVMRYIQTRYSKTNAKLKALFVAAGLFSTTASASGIDGEWKATIQTESDKVLPIVLHIDQDNGKWTGVLDSPSQKTYGIEMSSLEVIGNNISFEIEDLGLSYEGAYNPVVELMFGSFTQGKSLSLNFRKINTVQPENRPQTPTGPYPYTIEEVSFKSTITNNIISGTLTKPNSRIKATAILISGSGPQDRDETAFGHKAFAVIADYLTRQGYAVLRYDERGIGDSTGSFSTATTEDFANDTSAIVDYLNSRNDLPKGKTGLIGHSEGGMIAPMVASNRDDIAFTILLGGPGVKLQELFFDQWHRDRKHSGVTEKNLQELRKLDKIIFEQFAHLPIGGTISDELHQYLYKTVELEGLEGGKLEAQVEVLKKQYSTPWFRYALSFNPEPYLEGTKCPILALNGSLDFQVDAEMNLGNIEKVLGKSNHKDYEIIELDKMNHLFQTAETGSYAEYAEIEETFSPIALETMSIWLNERF
ncbi:alpha/beta hydrolase family protein [Microbulbifer sp. CNSA002]|uniref:alpha/beta hydrolase family protein n=1 Tax=Microbulbifer sp. CNSA002 TaxID=3373604 RepID=UPI0039B6AC7D